MLERGTAGINGDTAVDRPKQGANSTKCALLVLIPVSYPTPTRRVRLPVTKSIRKRKKNTKSGTSNGGQKKRGCWQRQREGKDIGHGNNETMRCGGGVGSDGPIVG